MNKMSIQWSVAGALAFCSMGGIAEVVDGEYCYFLQDGVQVPLEYTLTRPDGLPAGEQRPLVIMIHGGSWSGGQRGGLANLAGDLRSAGYVAATIDYRLTRDNPNNPMQVGADYTDIIKDVKCAVRYFRAQGQAGNWNIDPDSIAVLGSSAGGHLATQIGVSRTAWEDMNGQYAGISSEPQAIVNWYGPTDLAYNHAAVAASQVSIEALLGGDPDTVPGRYNQASPINHVDANDPPMLTIHGAEDETVPVAESRLFHDAFLHAGGQHRLHVIEDAPHGFVKSGPYVEYYNEGVTKTVQFLDWVFE